MRILLWEGDLYLNENVAEYLKFVVIDEIISAYNMYDMLYYIFDTDKEFDIIIIYTTFYYYPFKGSRSDTTEEAKGFVKSKNIKYIDKTENIDTLKTLAEMLKEISNK